MRARARSLRARKAAEAASELRDKKAGARKSCTRSRKVCRYQGSVIDWGSSVENLGNSQERLIRVIASEPASNEETRERVWRDFGPRFLASLETTHQEPFFRGQKPKTPSQSYPTSIEQRRDGPFGVESGILCFSHPLDSRDALEAAQGVDDPSEVFQVADRDLKHAQGLRVIYCFDISLYDIGIIG